MFRTKNIQHIEHKKNIIEYKYREFHENTYMDFIIYSNSFDKLSSLIEFCSINKQKYLCIHRFSVIFLAPPFN